MMRTILSLAGLGLAAGIFIFYTQPTYLDVQGLRTQIDQYNEALDKAAQLQSLKQSLLSRYNAFNPDDIDRLHKLLPDHVDNVRLVLDLDNLAGRYAMALQNVVISNPEEADSIAGTWNHRMLFLDKPVLLMEWLPWFLLIRKLFFWQ